MYSTTFLVLLAVLAAFLLNIIIPLARNVRIAKASGLPYVIVLYYTYNRLTSLLLYKTLLKWCDKYLGKASPTSWRVLTTGNWPWRNLHAPFAMLGTDTFLTVAPGGIVLHTCDADVTNQIISRPLDFPKASHLYRPMTVYGENVIVAEGAAWRHHRKLTSAVFGENNNRLVWKQSLQDGQRMLSGWLDSKASAITSLAQDTMWLSLSVISRAGLSQTMQSADSEPPPGHSMTFPVALTSLLRHIYYVIILPKWVLRYAPFKVTATSYLAYHEWGQYLKEVVSQKRTEMVKSRSTKSLTNDLLTQLLKEHEQPALDDKSKPATKSILSDSEILGNLFVILLAGHETSANSIHFCLILLAMHPHIQRTVQAELDQIFKGRTHSHWDYEKDFPVLLNSKLNAVVNEQLRLFPPAVTIPKYTTAPQTLQVNGKQVTVPAKTISRICVAPTHRNPACWSTLPDLESEAPDDLNSFKPSRWFNADNTWYQPPRGAYIPFSDGARACLGRRFAQVEILAVLALILATHSVELAIDTDIGSEGLESPSSSASSDATLQQSILDTERADEKLNAAWTRAHDQAATTMKDKMGITITLQINRGNFVPVTIAKRGEEKFAGLV